MISPDAIRALELDVVAAALAVRCETPLGERLAIDLQPLPAVADAVREAARVDEMRRCLELGRDVTLSVAAGTRDALVALAKEGLVLDGEALAALGRLLGSATRALDFLAGVDAPTLAGLAAPLPSLPAVEAELRRAVDEEGRLLDTASSALAAIRARRRVAQERLDRAVERFFDAHSELGERIATVREERTVVAVRSDLGPSRYGLVHGRSSSGATFYVEPFELVEGNNQAVVLRDEEAQEGERIRRALTARLRAVRGELVAASELVAALDFVRARARYARELGAGRAEAALDGSLELVEARHPLLVLEQLRKGASRAAIVPLTLALGDGECLVITGPNTGGKTVALKTVGLAVLSFACGVPVPAERARLPLLRALHIDIGDPQDIAQSLSTFSGHLRLVIRALSDRALPALVLLDELGAGTDPREGSALAIAVLDTLRSAGVTTLVTSHHEPLKRYALGTDGVRAAAVEFDERTLRPTYRLLVDRAGSSNALVIAERLGMPRGVIERARALLAGEVGELDRALARLDQASRAADGARSEAELERLALDEERVRLRATEEGLRRRESELKSRESGLRSRLREEAEARLASALAALRAEGAELIAGLAVEADRRRLEHKLAERLAESAVRVARDAVPEPGHAAAEEAALPEGAPRVGDRVRVRALGTSGTLVELDGRRATVDAGGKRLRVDSAALERLSGGEIRRESRVSMAVAGRDGLARELNVLGMTVEDAVAVVDKYLDDAVLARLPEVRIIHGHGTGRLRAGLQEHLRAHPAVREIETVSQGGATRAVLDA